MILQIPHQKHTAATIALGLLLVLCLTACGNSSLNAPPIDPASDAFVLVNANLYTMNPEQEKAAAMVVENGVITFVGDTVSARSKAQPNAAIIDLAGKTVIPGFQDVHMHPLEAESPFASTCLLSNEEINAENFIPELKACAPEQLATDWVLGAGHSVFTLLQATRLPIEILDEAIPDRPAVIVEETSHSVWVNSLALELAGIDKDTPNPQGGVIVKDADSGALTGILFDAAGDLVLNQAWLPTKEIKALNYTGLLNAIQRLNRFGITSVAEARTYWKRDFQDAWLQAEQDGKLTVRAHLNLWAYPNDDDDTQIATLKSLYRNEPDSLISIRQIKVYSDGIIINTTAAMLEDYVKILGDIPSANGLNYFSQTRLEKYIAALDPQGFDFHVHAIGDRAVRESLNAIEAAQSGNRRHRLTHLEVVNPDDYSRFKSLNVSADMQVTGEFSQPDHWPENEPLIGKRAAPLIPLKDIFNSGARIILSSDWDVSSLSPFVGIQNAVTREPQNLPNVTVAVKAYTLNAAYALNQEATTGSLEVGKFADFIVLDRNIFTIKPTTISQTRVEQTWLQGKLVFELRNNP